jgi:hypothetical protein
VADVEKPGSESAPNLLQLLMAAVGILLFVYVAALCVVVEFLYRHLIEAPVASLLAHLGWPKRH